MILKKDWETTKEQFSNLLVNNQINSQIQELAIKLCNKKLAEFPEIEEEEEEDKEMKKKVKEIVG